MDAKASIVEARTETQISEARRLFIEYSDWLNVDLCFQDFETELRTLPGPYARPDGFLFLAVAANSVAGCIAAKPLGNGDCEMKRLYVRPNFRGEGLGQLLVGACLSEATKIGYKRMLLDTFERMIPAVSLYRSFGFETCESYYGNPHAGVLYLQKNLAPQSSA